MPRGYFSLKDVDTLINECFDQGYGMETCYEGTLGYGKIVLIAPDDKHWNFIIQEVYLNCWSSAHTIRRTRKISNKIWNEIDNYYSQLESEEA